MVSTPFDSYFDSVMRDIERNAWSHHCSSSARTVFASQGLHEAIASGNEKAVLLTLLKNLRSVEEPLRAPIVEGTHIGFTPVMTALVVGDPQVIRLLVSYGATTVSRCPSDHHNTVLHYACSCRAVPSLDLLLLSVRRDALVEPNDEGLTPLHVASQLGYVDVVAKLLASAASYQKNF